jgi:hypothetical protein
MRRDKPESTNQLEILLAMPLTERIAAVLNDLRTRKDEFAGIAPHDLADALGVSDPREPGGGWHIACYAAIVSAEEYAKYHFPVSSMVDFLEDHAGTRRLQTLRRKFKERRTLEHEIAMKQLSANLSNGMYYVGTYVVKRPGVELRFQGDIEDDGTCIDLRTPYDDRDGSVLDFENCVTA